MMMEIMDMVAAMVKTVNVESESGSRIAFRWGASFSALFLLVLNLIGRRSGLQASFLAVFLLTSLPAVIFQILRGQFGCWVAFLAIAASYCFPCMIPVSRFLLFVVIPDWLANEFREGITGGVFCLLICISLVIMEIHGTGGCGGCTINVHCLGYWFSMALLFFFTILYLCLEPW